MSGSDALPRLAYIADVNVQNFCHGSLQLFRLLSGYPAEKLLIIETTWHCSEPERRLPGIHYWHLRPWWTRIFHQRRFPDLAPFLAKLATRRWRALARQIHSFAPEALLTVAHGFSWLAVSEMAQHLKLPLHLVVHDDWPRHPAYTRRAGDELASVFGHHYRRASSRLCVSATMEETYHKAYGVTGTVFYPTRAMDLAVAQEPPARLGREIKNLTVAFAGTLHPGQIAPLRLMANVLQALNGRLLIFGPTTAAELLEAGLTGPHVELRGHLPTPNALLAAFREEADLLYAPLPFDEAWRGNATLGFPSKLTDYTAAGLPILIHGPAWSAAAKWVQQEPHATLFVDSISAEPLRAALASFQQDAALRMQLARGALQAGERYFSAEAALEIFRKALLSTPMAR
jgi:glycosyltransferase involved in cell wall biosynthesis